MGTSAARRAPSSRVWRQAKLAATRYLASESGGAVPAREVVRRYLTALAETAAEAEDGFLTAFRLTRKAAQELGAFWEQRQTGQSLEGESDGQQTGLPAALQAHALAGAWLPPDGSLEEAAARATLVSVLQDRLAPPAGGRELPPAAVVRDFLSLAVATRLSLDLGEGLEAAAASAGALRSGQAELTETVAAALATAAGPPPSGWLTLAGWTWVTRALQRLLTVLATESPP